MSNKDVPKTWEEVFKHPRFVDLNIRAKTAEASLTAMTAERDALAGKLQTSADALKTAQTELTNAKAGQSDIEKLTADLAALQGDFEQSKADLAAANMEALRVKVATEKGLPLAFASRLRGDDEAALIADAETMAAYAKPVTPGIPPTPGRTPPIGITAAQMSNPAFVRENAGKIAAAVG